MKSFAVLILSVSLLLLQGCHSTNKVAYTYLVTNESGGNLANGLIHLTSSGIGNKDEEAIADAEKNAFNAILFKGVASSQQERPMITDDEAHAKSAHSAFFQTFFDQQGYRQFITAISNNGFKKDSDGRKITMIDIKISMDALRRNLENNNIIRKLGL